MNVADLLWQLTGSRSLRNIVHQIETAGHRAIGILALWQDRGRQRRALLKLDPALLSDIGRSQHEVTQECAKPVWRA